MNVFEILSDGENFRIETSNSWAPMLFAVYLKRTFLFFCHFAPVSIMREGFPYQKIYNNN